MMKWLGCGSGRGLQWNRSVCTQQDTKERRLSVNRGMERHYRRIMQLRAVNGTFRFCDGLFKVTASGLRASFSGYLKEFLQTAGHRTKERML
jgi:hypothetical protein